MKSAVTQISMAPAWWQGCHRRGAPLSLAVLLMFGSLAVFASDIDIDMTAADINTQGTRGERALRVSQRPLRRSRRRYARVWSERQSRKSHYRQESHVRLAHLPHSPLAAIRAAAAPWWPRALPRAASLHPGKPHSGKAPASGAVHAPIIVEVPQQNLTLAFVNPRHEPVAGLKLVARVQSQSGAATTLNDLTTDPKGRVTLTKINLPASVDLDISGQNATFSTGQNSSMPTGGVPSDAPNTEGKTAGGNATLDDTVQLSNVAGGVPIGEWDFANVESASLLLDGPRGHPHLARIDTPPRVAQRFTRLASLTLPSGTVPAGGSDRGRLAALPAEVRKVVVYDAEQPPIVVERNVVDVDVAAPPGSQVTTAALPGQAIAVPATGHVPVRLSLASLADGPVPIRVAQELPGGESEAVIDAYGRDPYAVNTTTAPALQLVRLSHVNLAQQMQVMATRDAVAGALGDPGDKKNRGNSSVSAPARWQRVVDLSQRGIRSQNAPVSV